MQNARVTNEDFFHLALQQRQAYHRICFGPMPESLSLELNNVVADATIAFIDKLISRACALAAFRCQKSSAEEFKKAKITLLKEDIDLAWIAMNSE